MGESESQPPVSKPARRRFRLTPGHLLVGLFLLDGFLWLSEHFRWFAFDEHKGWTVLIAAASVGAAMLLMFLWFAVSLLFRWSFQFSLRSLLFLAVVVAVPCSWLAAEIKQAEKQRSAKTAFRRFAGIIAYDYERTGPQRKPPRPDWLRRLLGEDFFADIEFVCLGADDSFTDVEMAHVASLPRLKDLNLYGAAIDNAGMEYIRGLRQLESLDIGGANITDAGLEQLKGLARLRKLDLGDTHITDAGLKHLQGLSQMQVLSLYSTQVTDAGLKHLQA